MNDNNYFWFCALWESLSAVQGNHSMYVHTVYISKRNMGNTPNCLPASQQAAILCYSQFPWGERDVISCTNPIVILINLYRVYIANYIV